MPPAEAAAPPLPAVGEVFEPGESLRPPSVAAAAEAARKLEEEAAAARPRRATALELQRRLQAELQLHSSLHHPLIVNLAYSCAPPSRPLGLPGPPRRGAHAHAPPGVASSARARTA